MPPDRIRPAADALIETLEMEIEALDALKTLYDQQLEAVRNGGMGPMDERTTEIQKQTATLQNLSAQSERQACLLGRVLGTDADEPSLDVLVEALRATAPEFGEQIAEAQTAVAERVQVVEQRRETLRLALEYAADLNHELLAAMHEAASDTDGQTYTAEGQPNPGSPDRSFVDTLG